MYCREDFKVAFAQREHLPGLVVVCGPQLVQAPSGGEDAVVWLHNMGRFRLLQPRVKHELTCGTSG